MIWVSFSLTQLSLTTSFSLRASSTRPSTCFSPAFIRLTASADRSIFSESERFDLTAGGMALGTMPGMATGAAAGAAADDRWPGPVTWTWTGPSVAAGETPAAAPAGPATGWLGRAGVAGHGRLRPRPPSP